MKRTISHLLFLHRNPPFGLVPAGYYGMRTVLSALVLFAAGFVHGENADAPCEPRVITDTSVVRSAGYRFDDHDPAGKEFRACVGFGSQKRLLVFCNGTQIGEPDSASTARFLADNPHFLSGNTPDSAAAAPRPATGRAAKLWGDESLPAVLLNRNVDRRIKLNRLISLGEWRHGLEIQNSIESAASTVLVLRNTLHVSGLAKVFFFYAGAGFHYSWFGGWTADTLESRKGSHFRNYSFSVTAGIPFLRYELKTASWIIPEFFWLEEDMVELMSHDSSGAILAGPQWKWDRSHLSNLAHAFYFRAGHVRVDLIFDRETYLRPVARLILDDMPSILGTWGASLTMSKEVLIPGIWIALPQITTQRISIRSSRFPLTVEPLRIHFMYRDLNRYNYGLTVRVHFGYQRTKEKNNEQ